MTDIPTGPRPSPGKEKGFVLVPHPDFPSRAIQSISVEAWKKGGGLNMRYSLKGALDQVLLPPPTGTGRADRLWEHSCFEAFVARPGEAAYTEFNFAPSGEWAAYGFDDYRAGMRPAEEMFASVSCFIKPDEISVWATAFVRTLPYRREWEIGLSAIIEAKDGSKSYWALAHAPGPPDFHNRDCFTARLAAPSRA